MLFKPHRSRDSDESLDQSFIPDAEDRISPFRLVCLFCAIIVYFGFFDRSLLNEWLTLPVLATIALYCACIHFGKPYRYLSQMVAGIVITAMDGILVAMWVIATGGMKSSFYVIFYVSIISVALRFQFAYTMLTAAFYTALYSMIYLLAGNKQLLSDLLIRSSHFFVAGGLAVMLAQLIRERSLKLAISNRTLKDENLRRRRIEVDLRRKQEELALADRRKDEFLAMLAHELRNPLASMYAAVDLLGHSDLTTELKEGAVSALNKRLHDLVRMVDDLLEVSRVTKGKILLCRESVDVGRVLSDSIEALRPDIERHGHILHFNSREAAGINVNGDKTRLEQIFTNLLQNAVKYTDHGGQIWVLVSSARGEVTVRIKDSGIGMEREMLKRVFGLFFQGDNSLDRTRGGLGIGLTLVKRLVEQHGGSIRASSDGPGTGSEFSVVLPTQETHIHEQERDMSARKPNPLPPVRPMTPAGRPSLSLVAANGKITTRVDAAAPAVAPCAVSKVKTLLVEDAPDVALLMSALLRRWGYDVEVATDGEMALDLFKQVKPGLVLLDIGLPKVDGYEVAHRIRSEFRDHDSILIALTGYGSALDKERAKACGFNVHLTKPVPPPLLKRLLQEALQP